MTPESWAMIYRDPLLNKKAIHQSIEFTDLPSSVTLSGLYIAVMKYSKKWKTLRKARYNQHCGVESKQQAKAIADAPTVPRRKENKETM